MADETVKQEETAESTGIWDVLSGRIIVGLLGVSLVATVGGMIILPIYGINVSKTELNTLATAILAALCTALRLR